MKRGRNQRRRQGVNPNRAYDSNGPDVRIRGTANQIYDKYLSLARDAASSGDRVKAENYLQHAEHYFRLIRAMQPNPSPVAADEGDSDGQVNGSDKSAERGAGADRGDVQPPAERGGERTGRGRRDRSERNQPAAEGGAEIGSADSQSAENQSADSQAVENQASAGGGRDVEAEPAGDAGQEAPQTAAESDDGGDKASGRKSKKADAADGRATPRRRRRPRAKSDGGEEAAATAPSSEELTAG